MCFWSVTSFMLHSQWHYWLSSLHKGYPWYKFQPQIISTSWHFPLPSSTANMWQISRTPQPLLCRRHKCMFPFWFFKVWSVTCLNANEILNFMKIKSSYLLLRHQRNQGYNSNYFCYFWTTFWWVYVSNLHIHLLFVTRFCFWNVNDGNGKLT